MNNNIIGIALDEIYRWFDILNKGYFNGIFLTPMITIQKGRKNNLGYITLDSVWNPIENNEAGTANPKKYEINITAENLSRPVNEIVGTLQHEMVHYENITKNVKDCSGQIHNKKFRELAETRGLICEKNKRVGWGITTNTEQFNDFINNVIKPDASVFLYFREAPVVEKKKTEKKIFKYTCPECKTEVKAKIGKNILCGDCNLKMEIESVDDEDGLDEKDKD